MYILILITIILDFLLTYFIPSYFNNLNLFYPMFTLTLVVFLYNKIDKNKYFKTIFIMGVIYDLLFSYIFLFNSLIFYLFGKIIEKVDKVIRCNFFVSLILVVVCIFLYDLILFMLVKISGYNLVMIGDLLYKFEHSIILNITFFVLLEIIKIPNKNNSKKVYRQIGLNCKSKF